MFLLMCTVLYKYRNSYGIEDFRVSSHDVLPCTSPSNVGPSMIRPTSMHNECDDDDSDEDDNVVQENSMQVVAEKDENDID